MRRVATVSVLAAFLLGGCLGGDDDSGGSGRPAERSGTTASDADRPSSRVTRSELKQDLAALQRIADRHGGTRAAGTPGYAASADFVAARLKDAGWKVTRQPVPFTYFVLHSASLAIGGRQLTRADDFQVYSYSGSGEAKGRLHEVGSGCKAGDFDGLQPGEIPLADAAECFTRVRAANAEKAGAKALVVREQVASARGVPSGTLVVPGIRIPVVVVSTRALGDAGAGSRASMKVDATSTKGTTENVIAETPGGSGDHVVMAGGHLDSVRGGPGIDDDGSGVVTLIEAAQAIGPNPPGAKVRLAFWAAEELGLLGSRRYVRSLGADERSRIEAYLNFDMVGSPNAVPAVYADGDAKLAELLRKSSRRKLGDVTVGAASDHTWFQLSHIPVNGLYTGSSEAGPGGKPRDPCYHLACDTIRNVDMPVLLSMAKTAAAAIRTLSERQAK
jgi:hypothetical protein